MFRRHDLAQVEGSSLVAQAIAREGIETLFGLAGGPIQDIMGFAPHFVRLLGLLASFLRPSHVERKQCSGVLPDCQSSGLACQRSQKAQRRRGPAADLQEMLQSVKLTRNV